MSPGGLVALAGGQPERPASWEQLLRAAVRPDFQVDVYRPVAGDPVLFGPTCAVAGCDARGLLRAKGIRGHFCQAHAVMWRRDGEPPQREWVAEGARDLRRARAVMACSTAGCRRSAHTQGLCQPHYGHWRRAGRPPLEVFGQYYRSQLHPLLQRLNTYLRRWAGRKYRRLRSLKRFMAWWAGLAAGATPAGRATIGAVSSTISASAFTVI